MRRKPEIAQCGAERGRGQHRRFEPEHDGEPGDDEREGERIGQQPRAQVNPTERQEPPAEQAIEPGLRAAIGRNRGECDRGGGKLDRRIEPAERGSAEPAPAAGGKPADEGNEVARSQHRTAGLAARAPPEDRSALRQTADENTEKAADKRGGDDHRPSERADARQEVEPRRLEHGLSFRPPIGYADRQALARPRRLRE